MKFRKGLSINDRLQERVTELELAGGILWEYPRTGIRENRIR